MKSEVSSQQSVGNGVGCFAGDGFQIVSNLISDSECNLLASELSILFENQQKSAKNKIGGVRNLLRSSLRVNETATSAKLVSRLEDLVGRNVFPVRAIFFDKTAESNWRVPWHQDLTIAVAEQIETPGFIAWSLKDGTLHVQPPREILAGRLALRLHLDDCRADNGALKIIPGISFGRQTQRSPNHRMDEQAKSPHLCGAKRRRIAHASLAPAFFFLCTESIASACFAHRICDTRIAQRP